jgi:phage-related protein
MDIYNISAWAGSTVYKINDIVSNGGYYYYATQPHTSTASFSNDLNAGLFNGTLTYNGITKPYFFWSASYGYNLDIKPNVKTIKFGDNYGVDLPDGINNILLKINLSFNNRDLAEYGAILHFLHTQAGSTQFFFTPPMPFNVVKKFVCQSWTPSQEFYENYKIDAVFEERVA